MPPKSSRVTSTGQLRPHSRSSSTTKLGANLQFTQKELQAPKHADRSKKAYPHEAHAHAGKVAPAFVRANSSQRVVSTEQLAVPAKRQQPYHQANNNGKAKAGFTIASSSEDGDDDEGWVSTESGAATPNNQNSDSDSDSDTASEADDPDPRQLQMLPPQSRAPQPQPQPAHLSARPASALARVETARPTDFKQLSAMERTPASPPSRQSAQPQPQREHPPSMASQQPQQRAHATADTRKDTTDARHPHPLYSPRPKRHSRPPSTHSITNRPEHQLRPHPLIRGQSYGSIHPPKPPPLAPLTVVPNSPLPELSTSPGSAHDGVKHYMSSSPTSTKTSSVSPVSADVPHSGYAQDRRLSFSSARSVNTIPIVHPMIVRATDRKRTLSTMSNVSSSAALSSLVHLPTVTRPPSPQAISFFPPVNPHANIEGIHPLLPHPYMANHLTVLSRRTPIREAFDRVNRAKSAR